MQILTLLPKVAKEIGAIAKTRRNDQQGYKFRGIDEALDGVHGPLSEHGVTPVPEVFDIEREERTTGKGTLLFYTRLKLRVTWTAPDGSSVATVTAGEAMDSGDKSTNKATSAAFKYACFLLFTIPLNEPDADEHTPEPVTATKPIEQPKPPRKLASVLGDLLHAMGCKTKSEADAVLRLCIRHSFDEALDATDSQVANAADLIGEQIAARMETLKGTRPEAMASILAEALEAQKKGGN